MYTTFCPLASRGYTRVERHAPQTNGTREMIWRCDCDARRTHSLPQRLEYACGLKGAAHHSCCASLRSIIEGDFWRQPSGYLHPVPQARAWVITIIIIIMSITIIIIIMIQGDHYNRGGRGGSGRDAFEWEATGTGRQRPLPKVSGKDFERRSAWVWASAIWVDMVYMRNYIPRYALLISADSTLW